MARRVLITGARSVAALELARDFSAAGWEVHLADSAAARMARCSTLPIRLHRHPAPRQQGGAFRQWVRALVEEYRIELVVPTCEEVFHLAAPSLHDWLGGRLMAPSLETLRTVHDKLCFARHCQKAGLPVPESQPIESADQLATYRTTCHEWVFKPRFSRFGDRALIAPKAARFAQLRLDPAQPWMAQAYIHGEEACFYAVAHHGQLTAFSAYCSRWRMVGGASYAFEPLDASRYAKLRTLAIQLAASARLHGQFACDAIFDVTETPFLLECNPRATSGVHLLGGSGHLARAMGDGIPAPDTPPTIRYLGPAMWLLGLPTALRHARLARWWRCLRAGRDAVSSPGDRWVLAGALADAAGFALNGLLHQHSTNAATTHDLEWNGEELP